MAGNIRYPASILALLLAMLIGGLAVSCQDGEPTSSKAKVDSSGMAATMPWWREQGFSFAPAPEQRRSAEGVAAGSASCVACHTSTDSHSMHLTDQGISCVDCHGGRADVNVPKGIAAGDANYQMHKLGAHVRPTVKGLWATAANPVIPGARTLEESADFIRFVNPGDLRAAKMACGGCHNTAGDPIVDHVERSMMTHGAMLWGAALYNNGSINRKNPIFGESYTVDGKPRKLTNTTRPTTREFAQDGILPQLWPLIRWEISQPGNILRVFESGAKRRPIVGIADPLEDPGKPDVKLSVRGYGTDVRTDPVFLGLQKTRLLDPTLNFFGTNDHPGDYRGSGCSACHVVYANDRSPVHSGVWASRGNRGYSFSKDGLMPKDEPGHPVEHKFVKSAPTSSCIVCHIHPGTSVTNSYLGYIWWDNETDGRFMYPKKQKYPPSSDEFRVHQHNPEGSAVRGLWSNLYPNDESHAGIKAGPEFLERVSELNPKLKHSQFADFHGHGWIFRAVYKQDRKGNLLDEVGNKVSDVDAAKLGAAVAYQSNKPGDKPTANTPVHLKDIHLEKGMHCTDCHFSEDTHGNGKLYGEMRNAVIVECIDCHGTFDKSAAIFSYLDDDRGREANKFVAGAFTGNAAMKTLDAGQLNARKKLIKAHFDVDGGKLIQKSAVDANKKWEVVQSIDTVNPKSWWAGGDGKQAVKPSPDAAATSRSDLARYAHTVRKDGKTWGALPKDDEKGDLALAHSMTTMSCYSCHTSWNTSCFGCHLPMRANQRKEMLHNEGLVTRNYTNYNFQTLRDDVYMLGIDSTVKGNRIVPIRSACAVQVSSQDANRQWIYAQQQTVSAEGFSGTAFSPYYPHTVRAVETKTCTDCHLSKSNDNNAVMAQLLLQGTNAANFVGRFAWVACGDGGVQAVEVTERDEPQAVIGSTLHELAYPDFHREHVNRGGRLLESHSHHGHVLDVQLRGEYLYAACGEEGFIAYDVANIDNKGFSERIITAPVSPLGQKFYVKTKYATSVLSPSTMALDPTRPRLKENEEGAIHLIYAFLYVTDKYEGLVVIGNPLDDKFNRPGVATLLDGNPSNNYLKKAVSFNPGGLLDGAKHMALHGTTAYISANAGLVVVDLENPLAPKVITTISSIKNPRRTAFQFRYALVCDDEGLKVLDITDPKNPDVIPKARLAIADARDIYLSRTYGYVAAGRDGLAIIDLEKPEEPRLVQMYSAEGKINDASAVRVAMTNASMFAYIADGRNGLKVVQLTSPEYTPGFLGFSPAPTPKLIAWHKTNGVAVSLSEGLDRDRAVDEAGNQLSVFGRRGARPFNLQEQQRLYLRPDGKGNFWPFTVGNVPEGKPVDYVGAGQSTTPAASQPATRRSPFGRPRP